MTTSGGRLDLKKKQRLPEHQQLTIFFQKNDLNCEGASPSDPAWTADLPFCCRLPSLFEEAGGRVETGKNSSGHKVERRFKRTADVGMMYKHVFLPFFNYYRTLKWVTFEHSLSQCDMLSVLKQENTEHNIKCMESVLDKLKTKLNMGFDDEGCAFYITILRNLIDQERDLNGISFQDPEMVSYEGSIKEGTMSTPVELEDTGTDRDANNASVTVPETNRSDSDSDLVVVVPESTCTIHEVTHIASVETRRERSHSDGLINNIEPEVPSSDFKLLARRLLENHIKRKYSNSEGYLKPEKN